MPVSWQAKSFKSFARHFIFWQGLMFNQISNGKYTYCLGGFVFMQVTDANEFGVYPSSLFVLWICEMKTYHVMVKSMAQPVITHFKLSTDVVLLQKASYIRFSLNKTNQAQECK